MYSIMLIEDDKKLCDIMKEYLKEHGYRIIISEDLSNIAEIFEIHQPDLVILDINLPHYDGFYLCKLIRKKSTVPIIFISARAGIMEQVMGMEVGADDYLTKPFRLEILLVKVNAFIRRIYGEFTIEETKMSSVGKLLLDGNRFKMYYCKKEIELSKNEYILLKKFMEQKDTIIKRDQLLIILWDNTTYKVLL